MNTFRKQELKRRIARQRGKVSFELPPPENGVNYLGKAPRKGSFNHLAYRFQNDVPTDGTIIGGIKIA